MKFILAVNHNHLKDENKDMNGKDKRKDGLRRKNSWYIINMNVEKTFIILIAVEF